MVSTVWFPRKEQALAWALERLLMEGLFTGDEQSQEANTVGPRGQGGEVVSGAWQSPKR